MLKATIIHVPETESTNIYAIELLSHNRPVEGSVIITDHQTKGKGLDSNSWESEKGKNLTFSIILYPQFTAEKQFILNKAVSLGIYDMLVDELPDQNVSIKWPNDIYIGDKKTCGILIQNSIMGKYFDYVVAGIGLNVNQTRFLSNAPNPVSLKLASGKDYNTDEILHKLLAGVFKRYTQVNTPEARTIELEYQQALYRLMEWHYYTVKGKKIYARITGTNEYGQLLLDSATGQVLVCDLKEVSYEI